MKASEFIIEVNIDSKDGLGATPNNQEIAYKGYKVMMRPSTFLKLALQREHIDPEKMDYIKNWIASGKTIGPAHLDIMFPDIWFDDWNPYRDEHGPGFDVYLEVAPWVYAHEGRHRMDAILQVEGDNPVETHIKLFTERNVLDGAGRHDALIQAANTMLRSQTASSSNIGKINTGPLWSYK